ncbi:MAG: hypothetical protein HXS48_18340 [Theionarchaea archaeon]|nr:hypothetical protein [Theionarchaea archaeon]
MRENDRNELAHPSLIADEIMGEIITLEKWYKRLKFLLIFFSGAFVTFLASFLAN